jgi:hypothetical protein
MQHIKTWKLVYDTHLSSGSICLLSVFLFEFGKGAAQL